MRKDTHILIGRIAGVHGLRGGLKIASYAESDELFAAGSVLLLGAGNLPYIVRQSSPCKRGFLLYLDGIGDRDQAQDLVGSDLFIEKSGLPRLEEGIYYWSDLIGLSVFTSQELFLGRLVSVIPTGSNDVYVVKNGKKETLIPALASVVTQIDPERGTMYVQLPEGLP